MSNNNNYLTKLCPCLCLLSAAIVLMLASSAMCQEANSELPSVKPKWTVEQMHSPAVVTASNLLLTSSELRGDGYYRQEAAYHEFRSFDLSNGQRSVAPRLERIPGAPLPTGEPKHSYDPGERLMVASADGSVILGVERRDVRIVEGRFVKNLGSVTELTLWDGKTLKPIEQQRYPSLECHNGSSGMPYVSVSPNGKHAAVWADIKLPNDFRREARLCRFDLSAGKITPIDRGIPMKGLTQVAALNDGTIVIAGKRQYIQTDEGSDEVARKQGYYFVAANGSMQPLSTETTLSLFHGLAVSPDGKQLAVVSSVSSKETVLLYDVTNRHLLGELAAGSIEEPQLAYSPDGKFLAIGTRGARGYQKTAHVLLWDLEVQRVAKRLDIAPIERSNSSGPYFAFGQGGALAFSPGSKYLAWERTMGPNGSYYNVWSLE